MSGPPVIVFDGLCNICSFGVLRVLRHDRDGIFRFAFAQGPVGSGLKAQYGLTPGDLENVALIEDGRCYVKSTAALKVLDRLPGPWRLLRVLWIVPRPLRDAGYSFIARNRYRFFGKRRHVWCRCRRNAGCSSTRDKADPGPPYSSFDLPPRSLAQ